MASYPKFVCLFLLITLSLSLQTYARDSQFFSKVSRNRDPAAATTTTKVDGEFVHINKLQEQKEQQPPFIPQTTETGYGLYSHDTGLNPPSTTTTTTTTASYNMDENLNNKNYDENNFNNYYKNNNEKNYAPELKGLSDNSNNGESKYYGARYNGGVEKQGMSDTMLFGNNGKYYYDVNANYNNNNNNNNKGYYGNRESNYEYYNNNNKNFYSENGVQGFHNQVPDEEFEFDQP